MKINNKGFMMAEIVVVSAVICTVLVTLFTALNRIVNLYDTRSRYYDINALYMAEQANLYLIKSKMINPIVRAGTTIKIEDSGLYSNINFYKEGNPNREVNIYYSPFTSEGLAKITTLEGVKPSLQAFATYLSKHFIFDSPVEDESEYEYVIISEICEDTNNCKYYGLRVV